MLLLSMENQLDKKCDSGEGAGPEATTSALVSDISSILRGKYKISIFNF